LTRLPDDRPRLHFLMFITIPGADTGVAQWARAHSITIPGADTGVAQWARAPLQFQARIQGWRSGRVLHYNSRRGYRGGAVGACSITIPGADTGVARAPLQFQARIQVWRSGRALPLISKITLKLTVKFWKTSLKLAVNF
jgi:hypothetical protein